MLDGPVASDGHGGRLTCVMAAGPSNSCGWRQWERRLGSQAAALGLRAQLALPSAAAAGSRSDAADEEEPETVNPSIGGARSAAAADPPLEEDDGSGLPVIPWAEIMLHRYLADIWVVVDGKVYDMTEFIASGEHPGGDEIPLEYGELQVST